MKKLIEVQEVENEGLFAFLGKKITIMCDSYFYTGILAGINATCVLLDNASIVYQTGDWSTKVYSDVQKLPTSIYIMIGKIEAFGELK